MVLGESRRLLLPVLLLVVSGSLTACGGDDDSKRTEPTTLNVPGDASTIQKAIDQAIPGDTIVVGAGTYEESVEIHTADVTLRGEDRNSVILEGGGLKGSGVTVTADGVTVENLTVRNFNQNGVLVTGMSDKDGGLARGTEGYQKLDPAKFPPIEGFAVRYVTVSNNGLYGVYAFDSHDGVIENNYASGHPDSGYYVGQCEQCNIVVRDNVAELNAVGYEQANASDSVVITGNRFSNNRVGLTLLSDYQEAFVPLRKTTVVGNLVTNNNAVKTPEQAEGGFGIGIGLSGTIDALVSKNRVSSHDNAGVVLTSSQDLPPDGNQILGNALAANSTDLWYAASDRAPGSGNCLEGNVIKAVKPITLIKQWVCPDGNDETVGTALTFAKAPAGISFREVVAAPEQPTMPASAQDLEPAAEPIDVEAVVLPAADLFADLVHTP